MRLSETQQESIRQYRELVDKKYLQKGNLSAAESEKLALLSADVNTIVSPGCGKTIHVIGTNGGTMHCGGILKLLDKTLTVELCGECEKKADL